MTDIQQLIDYKNKKTWFNVGFNYFHDSEIRTTFIRAKTVDDAINRFRELTDDEILNVWLFDWEDIEC